VHFGVRSCMSPFTERFIKLAAKIKERPALMPGESDRLWILGRLRDQRSDLHLAWGALSDIKDFEGAEDMRRQLGEVSGAIEVYLKKYSMDEGHQRLLNGEPLCFDGWVYWEALAPAREFECIVGQGKTEAALGDFRWSYGHGNSGSWDKIKKLSTDLYDGLQPDGRTWKDTVYAVRI
jgi:hypothetical protein